MSMVEVGIVTSADLSEQVVETEDAELMRVHDPDVSLEDAAIREFQKFKRKGRLFVGYSDIVVPIDEKESPNSFPRWTQYFLIRAMEQNGLPLDSVAELYGSGFVGAYLASEKTDSKIYIVEEDLRIVNMAMRWVGHNLDGNVGFVFSNSKKVSNGHVFKSRSREVHFLSQNPNALHDSVRARFYVTAVPYFPGDAGLPPWIDLGMIARKKGGSAVFVYSSLCDKMVKDAAKDLRAVRRVLLSMEKPVVLDSLEGAKEVVAPKKALDWEKYGLINYGTRLKPHYFHEWRVGMFEW